MNSIQVNSNINITVTDILKGVSQLETTDLEYFLAEISQMLAQRKINHLPERETDLLQKIHHNIPLDVRLRHRLLSKKLDEEAITNEEYSELKSVVTRIEKADVERLQALIELAQLRGISLDDLVEQLDLEYEEA
jgi:hypothetical protein